MDRAREVGEATLHIRGDLAVVGPRFYDVIRTSTRRVRLLVFAVGGGARARELSSSSRMLQPPVDESRALTRRLRLRTEAAC